MIFRTQITFANEEKVGVQVGEEAAAEPHGECGLCRRVVVVKMSPRRVRAGVVQLLGMAFEDVVLLCGFVEEELPTTPK